MLKQQRREERKQLKIERAEEKKRQLATKTTYRTLRKSVWVRPKKVWSMPDSTACSCHMHTKKKTRAQMNNDACACSPTSCDNALTMVECTGGLNCAMGKKNCGNRRIRKHQWARKLRPFNTYTHGWGLKVSVSTFPSF